LKSLMLVRKTERTADVIFFRIELVA